MWPFILVVYFGLNVAFAMFVAAYGMGECATGRDINPVLMFVINVFVGMFVFVNSMFDSVTCQVDVDRDTGDDVDSKFVRVINDFSNISF